MISQDPRNTARQEPASSSSMKSDQSNQVSFTLIVEAEVVEKAIGGAWQSFHLPIDTIDSDINGPRDVSSKGGRWYTHNAKQDGSDSGWVSTLASFEKKNLVGCQDNLREK